MASAYVHYLYIKQTPEVRVLNVVFPITITVLRKDGKNDVFLAYPRYKK